MKKLIIHIGHGKTGSSFLQSFLALNIKNLKNEGIIYNRPNDISMAQKGFITSGNGHRFMDSSGKLLFKKSLLKDNSYLFSDETFLHRLIKNEEFKKLISDLGQNLNVIVFTRNLFEHEFSVWGQLVKRHNCLRDLNSYLINNGPSGTYKQLINWIDASKKYNFNLVVRNYSNHKKNLIQIFVNDILNKEFKDLKNIKLPPKNKVNRSMNFTEYEVLRIINSISEDNKLADIFTNKLPNKSSSKLFCSDIAYIKTKSNNLRNIDYINENIQIDENIKIEEKSEVVKSEKNKQQEFLSPPELKIIADHLKKTNYKKDFKHDLILTKNEINRLKKIALKIERKEEIELIHALFIMNLVNRYNYEEGNIFFKNKLDKLRKRIKNNKKI